MVAGQEYTYTFDVIVGSVRSQLYEVVPTWNGTGTLTYITSSEMGGTGYKSTMVGTGDAVITVDTLAAPVVVPTPVVAATSEEEDKDLTWAWIVGFVPGYLFIGLVVCGIVGVVHKERRESGPSRSIALDANEEEERKENDEVLKRREILRAKRSKSINKTMTKEVLDQYFPHPYAIQVTNNSYHLPEFGKVKKNLKPEDYQKPPLVITKPANEYKRPDFDEPVAELPVW
jgi:hypothetical protein